MDILLKFLACIFISSKRSLSSVFRLVQFLFSHRTRSRLLYAIFVLAA